MRSSSSSPSSHFSQSTQDTSLHSADLQKFDYSPPAIHHYPPPPQRPPARPWRAALHKGLKSPPPNFWLTPTPAHEVVASLAKYQSARISKHPSLYPPTRFPSPLESQFQTQPPTSDILRLFDPSCPWTNADLERLADDFIWEATTGECSSRRVAEFIGECVGAFWNLAPVWLDDRGEEGSSKGEEPEARFAGDASASKKRTSNHPASRKPTVPQHSTSVYAAPSSNPYATPVHIRFAEILSRQVMASFVALWDDSGDDEDSTGSSPGNRSPSPPLPSQYISLVPPFNANSRPTSTLPFPFPHPPTSSAGPSTSSTQSSSILSASLSPFASSSSISTHFLPFTQPRPQAHPQVQKYDASEIQRMRLGIGRGLRPVHEQPTGLTKGIQKRSKHMDDDAKLCLCALIGELYALEIPGWASHVGGRKKKTPSMRPESGSSVLSREQVKGALRVLMYLHSRANEAACSRSSSGAGSTPIAPLGTTPASSATPTPTPTPASNTNAKSKKGKNNKAKPLAKSSPMPSSSSHPDETPSLPSAPPAASNRSQASTLNPPLSKATVYLVGIRTLLCHAGKRMWLGEEAEDEFGPSSQLVGAEEGGGEGGYEEEEDDDDLADLKAFRTALRNVVGEVSSAPTASSSVTPSPARSTPTPTPSVSPKSKAKQKVKSKTPSMSSLPPGSDFASAGATHTTRCEQEDWEAKMRAKVVESIFEYLGRCEEDLKLARRRQRVRETQKASVKNMSSQRWHGVGQDHLSHPNSSNLDSNHIEFGASRGHDEGREDGEVDMDCGSSSTSWSTHSDLYSDVGVDLDLDLNLDGESGMALSVFGPQYPTAQRSGLRMVDWSAFESRTIPLAGAVPVVR